MNIINYVAFLGECFFVVGFFFCLNYLQINITLSGMAKGSRGRGVTVMGEIQGGVSVLRLVLAAVRHVLGAF